jgi:predicted outer membrane protein
MIRKAIPTIAVMVVLGALAFAQGERRPASPNGTAAAEIGSSLEPVGAAEPVYKRGKWIEM